MGAYRSIGVGARAQARWKRRSISGRGRGGSGESLHDRRNCTGLRGALGVGQSILRGGRNKELTTLRRELGTHWLIRGALHHFQQKDYSHLVHLLNASTRESLGEINRDESTRLLWNVVRRQPRLALLGLRGLLMGRG